MKYGLIVEGGGMKCVYSAAILDKFIDDDINFDYGIGVSAGSANLASYLAGQRNRTKRFYTVHNKDWRYLSLRSLIRRGSLFGLDYIYGDLSNEGGGDPIHYEAMMKNPCEMELVTTDAVEGTPVYLDKMDVEKNNYWAFKASCALPVACRPVQHNGHIYYDGGVSDSIPVDRALAMGCDKLVVLMSKPVGYKKEPQKGAAFFRAALKKYPAMIKALEHRHEMYNRQLERVYELEREGKVFLFMMSEDKHISVYTKDSSPLLEVYDLGLSDYETKKQELLSFLGRP